MVDIRYLNIISHLSGVTWYEVYGIDNQICSGTMTQREAIKLQQRLDPNLQAFVTLSHSEPGKYRVRVAYDGLEKIIENKQELYRENLAQVVMRSNDPPKERIALGAISSLEQWYSLRNTRSKSAIQPEYDRIMQELHYIEKLNLHSEIEKARVFECLSKNKVFNYILQDMESKGIDFAVVRAGQSRLDRARARQQRVEQPIPLPLQVNKRSVVSNAIETMNEWVRMRGIRPKSNLMREYNRIIKELEDIQSLHLRPDIEEARVFDSINNNASFAVEILQMMKIKGFDFEISKESKASAERVEQRRRKPIRIPAAQANVEKDYLVLKTAMTTLLIKDIHKEYHHIREENDGLKWVKMHAKKVGDFLSGNKRGKRNKQIYELTRQFRQINNLKISSYDKAKKAYLVLFNLEQEILQDEKNHFSSSLQQLCAQYKDEIIKVLGKDAQKMLNELDESFTIAASENATRPPPRIE
ncbi:MAG: hypothetical protein AB7I18_02210 [Candidatus Berkiella sp.]